MALFTGEMCGEKGVDQFLRGGCPDDPAAQHQHVHIVMFHTLVGGINVVTEAAANAGELIHRDGCSDTAAANQNAAFGLAGQDGIAHLFRIVGVIDGVCRVSSYIKHAKTKMLQVRDYIRLKFHARVVRSDDDGHDA